MNVYQFKEVLQSVYCFGCSAVFWRAYILWCFAVKLFAGYQMNLQAPGFSISFCNADYLRYSCGNAAKNLKN